MTPGQWQRLQRRLAALTVAQLGLLWRQLQGSADIGADWAALNPQAVAAVTSGQYAAAARATEYVSETVTRQGATSQAAGTVQAGRFAGVASDGRRLDTLLDLPVVTSINALHWGHPMRTALALGRQRLGMLASTQVYDAGRVAAGVAVTADRTLIGYRRRLRGASNCSRCIVLAGRFYRWNKGFQRHPQCDCEHEPVVEQGTGAADFQPEAHFASLTTEEQDRVFTKAGAQAIRDGADLNQVVNARRGMSTAASGRQATRTTFGRQAFTTTEGATRRPNRLMPEQIYLDATSRDDAIRLLQAHGYIS